MIDRALAYGVDSTQPVATFRPANPEHEVQSECATEAAASAGEHGCFQQMSHASICSKALCQRTSRGGKVQPLLHHVRCAHRTQDNRMSVAVLCKAVQGEHWRRLFRGDPDGARCLLPPYRLAGRPNFWSLSPTPWPLRGTLTLVAPRNQL